MFCEHRERLCALLRAQVTDVVERQNIGLRALRKGSAEAWQTIARDRLSSRLQRLDHRWIEGLDAIERGGDAPEEHARVIITRCERHPGERPLVSPSPLAHERRLSVPGGGGDRDDGRCSCSAEPVDERGPGNDAPR
jgi:hypothetical protein